MKHIPIDYVHYHVYVAASRRLSRHLGPAAPTATTLIQRELSQRTPRLIADEYLDSIRRRANTGGSLRVSSRRMQLSPPAGDPRRN